jgi:hypothetical protein
MRFARPAYVDPKEIDFAIDETIKALAPDVVRIRYSFEDDWTGDASIFFRIVLSDEATKIRRLSETARLVSGALDKELSPEEFGLHSYFNFRSFSETQTHRDPAWE